MRRPAALLLVVMLGGCSIYFVRPPPPPCTTSRVIPTLETVGAITLGAVAAYGYAQPQDPNGPDFGIPPRLLDLLAAGTAIELAISALIGFAVTAQCNAAQSALALPAPTP